MKSFFIKLNRHDRTKSRTQRAPHLLVSKYVPALYIAISTLVLFHDQAVKSYSIIRVIAITIQYKYEYYYSSINPVEFRGHLFHGQRSHWNSLFFNKATHNATNNATHNVTHNATHNVTHNATQRHTTPHNATQRHTT